MKHNRKLFLYLQSQGLLDLGTEEQIANATKEYRKLQDKTRLQKYRKKHHRNEISLTQQEFEFLASAAQKRGMQLGTFIRLAAIAFVKREFLLPSDDRFRELEVALRRIGNNINQLTKHVHQRGFTPEDQLAFQQKLNELEDQIVQALRQPLPQKDSLKRLLKQQPEYANVLEQVLIEFHHDNENK